MNRLVGRALAPAAALAILLTGCASSAATPSASTPAAQATVTVTDNKGTVTVKTPPTSVVALDNRTFQTLADWDIKPKAAARSLMPSTNKYAKDESIIDIGTHNEPKLELITAAEPDLIINGQRFAGKYDDIKTHEYSAADFERIDNAILNEEKNMRGANVRYWDEVQEGEELPEIVRGPLSLMDTMGFLVGSGRGHTHGVIFKNAVKHPGHFFRNPEAGGGIEYTGICHHRESTAKEVGVPGVYDYGPQRSSWMASLVTNWMGDAGFLKRIRTQMRGFNIMGDCTWARGKVTRKYIKDGNALVDIEIRGENQRGELTTPGLATVLLPSLNPQHNVFFDGRNCDLELPVVR